MFENSERYNGIGTHHDRFLTGPEMVLLGVGLYRATQWYQANHKALTPQQQAEREIEVARWKAYLLWEAHTPGAKEAREAYQFEEEQAEIRRQNAHATKVHAVWLRILTLPLFWLGGSCWVPGVGDAGPFHNSFIQGTVEAIVGTVAWYIAWTVWGRLRNRIAASVARVRAQTALQAEFVHTPSDNLPVLWRDKTSRP